MAPQVTIVGAGMTGSALAFFLKEAGMTVRVLEKSRGPGGRMATHRLRQGDRSSPVVGRADLGAQYVSTRSATDHPVLGPIYKRLIDAGVLALFEGKIAGANPYGGSDDVRHYTAPQGLQTISEHFLEAAAMPTEWGVSLDELSTTEEGGARLTMTGAKDVQQLDVEGSKQHIIVLTQPVPQILGSSKFPVRGNFLEKLEASVLDQLKQIEYSSRYAAAFFFEGQPWPYDWAVQYFDPTGDVRYVSHDNAKRGATDEPMMSIVVHGGVPHGLKFLEEEEPWSCAKEVLAKELAEKMPEIDWAKASAVKMHKWRYSQVYKGFGNNRPDPTWIWKAGEEPENPLTPGCLPLFRTDNVLCLLAGDAMAPSSNFEGCIFSAYRAASVASAFFGGK